MFGESHRHYSPLDAAGFFFAAFQRAAAAFLAIAVRSSGDKFSALFLPPRRPSATAAEFFAAFFSVTQIDITNVLSARQIDMLNGRQCIYDEL
jgi:hypothetical protein